MELVVALLLGFATAFVGSMPIAGPLAVLVVEHAVRRRRRSALFTALGGAVAEGFVALLIGLLFPLLYQESDVLVAVARALGALVIGAVGVTLLVRPSKLQGAAAEKSGVRSSFWRGVLAAGLNPTIYATWLVVLTTFFTNGWLDVHPKSAPAFGLGVALGVFCWFALAVTLAHRLSYWVTDERHRRFVQVLGVMLVGCGVYLSVRFVSTLS